LLPRSSLSSERARREDLSPPRRRRRREDSSAIVRNTQAHEETHRDRSTTVGVGFRFVGFPSVEGIIFSRNGDTPDASEILNHILHSDLGGVLHQLLQQYTDAQGTPPAAVSEVESLPVLTIQKDESESEKQCAVCMCDFTTGDQAKQMPCKHIFHPDCIHPWLAKHNSCPNCRQELRTDDVAYERRKELNRV
jgi:hypothetical protein